jgi:hypothetical protein
MRFHKDYTDGRIPPESIMIVPYHRIMQDFDNLMHEIMEFTGTDTSPLLSESIRKTAEKQKAYRSKHVYDLKKFGLDASKIQKDYAPIYQTFFKNGS